MKTVVYTCITGGYDCLKEVPRQFMDKDLDFVCYTDDSNLKSETWSMRMIPEELSRLTDAKKNRIIKICPNKFFPEYEASLYIDGSMEIIGSIVDLLKQCDLRKCPVWMLKHPVRNCAYSEEKAVLIAKKDSSSITNAQMKRYLKEGYPRNYGLTENRILYRAHNNELCKKTMFLWANELLKGSHRDQLSFNYCCWKTGLKYCLFDTRAVKKTFRWNAKHFKYEINNIMSEKNIEKISGKVDSIDIYTVNFNSSELTNAWIKSILKNVSGINYRIFIVDNSDQKPFVLDKDMDRSLVNVIDNTDDKTIPVRFAAKYFRKIHTSNNDASFKHMITIQWILDNCNCDNLLLSDCDTILKRNLDFLDSQYVTIASVQPKVKDSNPRFRPLFQYFNIKLIRSKNIRYFDQFRTYVGNFKDSYDTGASFYEDVCNFKLPYKVIEYDTYVSHLRGGSYMKLENRIKTFLSQNKQFFETDNTKLNLQSVLRFNDLNKGKSIHQYTSTPKTIQDKLTWLNIHDVPWSNEYNKPLKSVCADKLLAKEYICKKLGSYLSPKTLFVYNRSSEIDWGKLPNKFVLKVNHNSGGRIICRDKSKLNVKECIAKIDRWMATDFTFQNGFESHYHWIERKIFVEELLEDEIQKDSLIDYRCWCFNGHPKYFSINAGNGHGEISCYDLSGNFLELYPRNKSSNWKMPQNFSKMKEYAAKLSEDFKFVRVDFYEVNGKVYIGELTFTPGVCTFKYNGNYDQIIGNMLQI